MIEAMEMSRFVMRPVWYRSAQLESHATMPSKMSTLEPAKQIHHLGAKEMTPKVCAMDHSNHVPRFEDQMSQGVPQPVLRPPLTNSLNP